MQNQSRLFLRARSRARHGKRSLCGVQLHRKRSARLRLIARFILRPEPIGMVTLLQTFIDIIVAVVARLPGKTAHLHISAAIHAHQKRRHTHAVVKGKGNGFLRVRPVFRQRRTVLQNRRIGPDIVHPVCIQVMILRHRHLCSFQNFSSLTARLGVPSLKRVSRLLRGRQITVSGVIGHLLRLGTVASRCVLIIVCDGILVRRPLRVESLVVRVGRRELRDLRIVRKCCIRVPAVKGITRPFGLRRCGQSQSLTVCVFLIICLICYRSAVFLVGNLIAVRRPPRIEGLVRRHWGIKIVRCRAGGIGIPALNGIMFPDRRAVYRFHNLTAAHHKPCIGMRRFLILRLHIAFKYAFARIQRYGVNPRRSLRGLFARARGGGKRILSRLIDAKGIPPHRHGIAVPLLLADCSACGRAVGDRHGKDGVRAVHLRRSQRDRGRDPVQTQGAAVTLHRVAHTVHRLVIQIVDSISQTGT